MAQLRRLRGQLDAQERVFTTVRGLADFVSSLGPTRGNTCAVRLCFLRGEYFSTERYSGTHLEFIDAESAESFDEVRKMLEVMPLNIVGSEICRLTVWERSDLSLFTPGTVYEIRHIFNFNLYNGMPQASATRACVEDRTAHAAADVTSGASDAPRSPPPTQATQIQHDTQQAPQQQGTAQASSTHAVAVADDAQQSAKTDATAESPTRQHRQALLFVPGKAQADLKRSGPQSNSSSVLFIEQQERQSSSGEEPPAKRTRMAKMVPGPTAGTSTLPPTA